MGGTMRFGGEHFCIGLNFSAVANRPEAMYEQAAIAVRQVGRLVIVSEEDPEASRRDSTAMRARMLGTRLYISVLFIVLGW